MKSPRPLFIKILNENIKHKQDRSPSAATTLPSSPRLSHHFAMGMQSGTSNWARAGLDYFLSILEVILPLKPVEWEEVKTRFDAKFGKTKEPTGDPQIPFSPLFSQDFIPRHRPRPSTSAFFQQQCNN